MSYFHSSGNKNTSQRKQTRHDQHRQAGRQTDRRQQTDKTRQGHYTTPHCVLFAPQQGRGHGKIKAPQRQQQLPFTTVNCSWVQIPSARADRSQRRDTTMVAANIVFNSAAWRATLGATPTGTVAASVPPTQSWGRAVSRHLRLVALLGQIPDSKSRSSANGNHHDSAGYSEAVLPQEMTTSLQQEHRQNPDASPHPLHCAASQGMLEAGAALLAANSNTVSVRDSSGRYSFFFFCMTLLWEVHVYESNK